MRTKVILSILLPFWLSLGLTQGQQKQMPLSVDDLSRAARSGDTRAIEQLRALASRGNASAQFALGGIYQNGEGAPKDTGLAVQQYMKAAQQGHPEAQYTLGWMYDAGEGVAKDPVIAAEWYTKAGEKGNVAAQYSLGFIYENGRGVPKNPELAIQWYGRAAAQGDSTAQRSLERLRAASQPLFEVGLRKQGDLFLVPVLINSKIPLDFILDSGASDVSIPADVVLTLMRTGTLTEADFTGKNTYRLADGSTVPSQSFRIRSLKVGDKSLENVSGSLSPVEGALLLGQSFLGRLKSWSVDNVRQVLVLK